jgi:hypothetical protein
VATCTTQSLPAGSDVVKAAYNGDGNFNPIGGTFTQTISKINSVAAVTSPGPSDVNQGVLFTATVMSSSSGPIKPTGTVTFTITQNNNSPVQQCLTPVTLSAADTATCGSIYSLQATYSPYTVQITYSGDNNFNTSTAMWTQVVNKTRTAVINFASSPNPSVATQSITFTATVQPVYSGPVYPTGIVTFVDTSQSKPSPVCSGPTVTMMGTTTAACSSTTVSSGVRTITATYQGDSNFVASNPTELPTQTVRDYSLTFSPSYPTSIAPGSSNNPSSFSLLNQIIMVTVVPVVPDNPDPDLVTLTCSVPASSPLSCSVSPTSLQPAKGSTMVTVTAGTSGAPGFYPVTVAVADNTTSPLTMLSHQITFQVQVINTSQTISVLPGGSQTATAIFSSTSAQSITFSQGTAGLQDTLCTLVTGSNANGNLPPGGESLSNVGMGCTITPNPQTQPFNSGTASLKVTITTSSGQTAMLRRSRQMFAALWLGMPAIVLIGSLRRKELTRKTILRLMGFALITVAIAQGLGCGGGFKNTPVVSSATPTGYYQVLVQGKGSDGVTYSAIVPVNVGH